MNRAIFALLIALTFMTPVVGSREAFADSHTASLVSDLPSPQPVGTTITWTVLPPEPELFDYRLSVSPINEPLRVMYDFYFRTEFEWTPIEDGEYLIQLAVMEKEEGAIELIEANFVIESRVVDSPLVTPTDHPLIALYSAPPCESGEMRVVFIRWGGKRPYFTDWKPCQAGQSMNFYIAGMRAGSWHLMVHQVFDDGQLVAQGPLMVHKTGEVLVNLPKFTVTNPANPQASLEQPVTLYSPGVFFGSSVLKWPVATDFSGEVIWYYEPPAAKAWASYITRPLPGGNMLVIEPTFSLAAQVLKEVDIAGNTVRVVSTRRINEQLVALGQDKINGIHHEATRFPNGQTLIIGAVEKIVVDEQGPGAVNVLGDMVIALDENFQVVWVWNTFDYLDVTRLATLGEICVTFCNTPIFLDDRVNDWIHSNAITYSSADGNLLLSVRNQDWVVKIDYKNGTGSGDIIWKLGRDGDFTIESDDPYPWFTHQHDAKYISDNQIILYDNGQLRCGPNPDPADGCHSRGQVLNIDEENMVVSLAHNTYLGNFSKGYGSAQKLLNGNYSFTSGQNTPFSFATTDEFLPDGTKVFSVITADPLIYRSFRMESMYAP
ncbi:MAG: aryl-sulfate sulfotransferase [Chloroflexi bacterium]|nr:aryl-sulfate sulfotransferase [Chloroflexota bacterium]